MLNHPSPARIQSDMPLGIGCVYTLGCARTGDLYVGTARCLKTRFLGHVNALRAGRHPIAEMQRLFWQYGHDGLCGDVIEVTNWPGEPDRRGHRYRLESLMIFLLQPSLNRQQNRIWFSREPWRRCEYSLDFALQND